MSIGKLYSKGETGAKVRKAFFVPLAELYLEDGYNVRDADQQHVEEFRDAYISGEYVPPLAVEVTTSGIKIIDGQHRYLGARLAAESGIDLRLEVNDITGYTEADKIALMITSSQGKPLEPLERARAYARLKRQGKTNEEIAKLVKRSVSDVGNMLALSEAPESIKSMVKAGEMSYVTATELTRQHGAEAESVAMEALEAAKAEGKTKVTRRQTATKDGKFNNAKAVRFVELASRIEIVAGGQPLDKCPDDHSVTMRCPAGIVREMEALLKEYLEGVK